MNRIAKIGLAALALTALAAPVTADATDPYAPLVCGVPVIKTGPPRVSLTCDSGPGDEYRIIVKFCVIGAATSCRWVDSPWVAYGTPATATVPVPSTTYPQARRKWAPNLSEGFVKQTRDLP